jgi:hypothetical protein
MVAFSCIPMCSGCGAPMLVLRVPACRHAPLSRRLKVKLMECFDKAIPFYSSPGINTSCWIPVVFCVSPPRRREKSFIARHAQDVHASGRKEHLYFQSSLWSHGAVLIKLNFYNLSLLKVTLELHNKGFLKPLT